MHQSPFTVLVFGGSQGAQSINRGVLESLSYLSDWKAKLRFVHQTGEKQAEEIRKAYAEAGFDSDVRAFFNDFHQQYAAADLIVSRAGATTVAEIKAAGRASILIPLPTDAAVLISNAELNGETLSSAIRSMLSDPKKLDAIEKNARRIAVLDAEQRIVDLAERAAEMRGRRV
jgi:UDP-N-acetylglucosamine--N-acetylmuramyl-(pentapeptide) pyrophosphoryl-undecaprenol N-acetylglucosamine transferase